MTGTRAIFLILVIAAVMHLALSAVAEERDLTGYTNNVKALVQGIELWTNDHGGNFPTAEEFKGPKFLDYIKKTSAGDPKAKMKDPASGKPFEYQSFQAKKDYIVRCPSPEIYGMEKLYYSRTKGFVSVKLPEGAAKPAPTSSTASTAGPSKKPVAAASQKAPEKPAPSPGQSEKPSPTGKPIATPAPSPAKTTDEKGEKLSEQDREKISGMITDLYNAYEQKNLEKILEIQHTAIENSAVDYEKRKKGTADEVREAFRDATKEIIEHKDFKMKPLNMGDLTFQKKGKYCKVTSVVPIIASERLEIEEEGKYFFIRLRIGEFIFEQQNDSWTIVNMYLY